MWKPKLQLNPGLIYNYSSNKLNVSANIDFLNEELRDLDSIRLEAIDKYYYTNRLNAGIASAINAGKNSTINITGGYSYYNRRKNTYVVNLVNLDKSLSDFQDLHDSTNFHLFYQKGYYSLKLKKNRFFNRLRSSI
ncbi:MAG: hypothetical protein HC906_16135 [Bacteroidales bacterium]|nr:hypothetical protein [Bacteroidales bacterium]